MARRKVVGDPKKAIGYIRTSTSDQDLSPGAQRSQIDRWCKAHDAELVEVVLDRGVSGSAPIDKRPGLMDALNALRNHGAGILIVAKRDRLARDIVIAAAIQRLAQRHGAVIQSADSAGNGTTPEAELMRGLIDLFAQYERACICSRTKAAAAQKKARGERWGSVPFGFLVGPDGKTLRINQVEQDTIDRIRALRDANVSLRTIVQTLNRDSIPCRGSRWHLTTVARILTRLSQALSAGG